jgi:hypothetical protein
MHLYITTDFATSQKTSADFSVISVWAYNNNGDWFWVDGVCKKQLMDKNVDIILNLTSLFVLGLIPGLFPLLSLARLK